MANEGDIANDIMQHDIDVALSARQQAVGESARECEDCGDEIPAGRRKAAPGCTRCVLCQSDYDKWQGNWP